MGRSKEKFIKETGGFRFGESQEEFAARQARLNAIQKKVKDSTATPADLDVRAALLGADEDDEPMFDEE